MSEELCVDNLYPAPTGHILEVTSTMMLASAPMFLGMGWVFVYRRNEQSNTQYWVLIAFLVLSGVIFVGSLAVSIAISWTAVFKCPRQLGYLALPVFLYAASLSVFPCYIALSQSKTKNAQFLQVFIGVACGLCCASAAVACMVMT